MHCPTLPSNNFSQASNQTSNTQAFKMSSINDVQNAIATAQSVADSCRALPTEFSVGGSAANDMIQALEAFNRFKTSQTTSADDNGEFSLSANLAPCLVALESMRSIRERYDRRPMGVRDRMRWKTDSDKFTKEVSALFQATSALRETVDMLERTAARAAAVRGSTPPRQTTPPRPETPTGAPTHTPTRTPTQRDTPARPPPNQPITPSKAKLPMCPNGSGCRVPLCWKTHNHPPAPQCPEGRNCPDSSCTRWHPQSRHCERGPACSLPFCSKAHPWPRVVNSPGTPEGQNPGLSASNSPSPITPQVPRAEYPEDWSQMAHPAVSVSSLGTSSSAPTLDECELRSNILPLRNTS